MNVSCVVCVCLYQIASWGQRAQQTQQNKTKIKQKNGIIIADTLKNKQRHKLYRDSDIILITRPLFHAEISHGWAFFFLVKGFCCYCFKWQQRAGERDGGRDGVVIGQKAFSMQKHLPFLFSTLSNGAHSNVSSVTGNRWGVWLLQYTNTRFTLHLLSNLHLSLSLWMVLREEQATVGHGGGAVTGFLKLTSTRLKRLEVSLPPDVQNLNLCLICSWFCSWFFAFQINLKRIPCYKKSDSRRKTTELKHNELIYFTSKLPSAVIWIHLCEH